MCIRDRPYTDDARSFHNQGGAWNPRGTECGSSRRSEVWQDCTQPISCSDPFGAELTLVSPKTLMMPDEIVNDLRSTGATISESTDLITAIPDADVIYMTRIQKERFPDEDEYAKVAGIYMLDAKDMSGAKEGMIVMHPLPRVSELHPSLDSTVNARYFQQAFNGVPTRMALLCRSLGVKIPKEVKK